jgi:hypothetical protein
MIWNGKWNGANAIVVHTPQSFRSFKRAIRSLGDVWADWNHVYFSQCRDLYSAAYLPCYPDKSPEDSTITYHWLKETWSKEGPRAVGMNIQ